MDEARRFLRYVSPGLLFGVQALLLLGLLRLEWTWRQLGSLKEEGGIGAAATLFLASGGLGFLFSVAHHSLHSLNWSWLSCVDHSAMLKYVIDNKGLRLVSRRGTCRPENNLDRPKAWAVTTSVWRQALVDGTTIKAADPGTAALMDMTHAAGAARVSGLCATIAGIGGSFFVGWLSACPGPRPGNLQLSGVALLGCLLVLMHHRNYMRAGRLAQSVIDAVFTDAFVRQSRGHDRPPLTTVVDW